MLANYFHVLHENTMHTDACINIYPIRQKGFITILDNSKYSFFFKTNFEQVKCNQQSSVSILKFIRIKCNVIKSSRQHCDCRQIFVLNHISKLLFSTLNGHHFKKYHKNSSLIKYTKQLKVHFKNN